MSPFFRHFSPALLLVLLQGTSIADCVDSLWLSVMPVQCNGLRNGSIQVDSVFGGKPPYYFSLDGASYSTRPVFDHLRPGEYNLIVKDATGCTNAQLVLIEEPELLQVKLRANKALVTPGTPLSLRAEVVPGDADIQQIEWRPPQLFSAMNMLDQTVAITQTTNFAIEVQDKNGCIARAQVVVETEEANLYFPNVIKPGSNEDAYFTVFAGEGVATIVTLEVYNRVGCLLFERRGFTANDPLKGWNGRANGKVVQPGVYSWRAVIEYNDGRQQQFLGSVTVVN